MPDNQPNDQAAPGEWLRGYNKHTYWVGETKQAEIATGRRPVWTGIYLWSLTLSDIRGNAPTLVEARRRVELALQGIYQLDLFGFDVPETARLIN